MPPYDSIDKTPVMRSLTASIQPALQSTQDALVSTVNGFQLRNDAPFSPDIPKDLAKTMPDLSGRLLLTFPWSKSRPVDPTQHTVWIFDNTAFRIPPGSNETRHRKRKANASMKAAPNDPVPPPRWQVEYVVAFFSRQTRRDASHVVADIAKIVGLIKDIDSEEQLGKLKDQLELTPIKKRIEPFLEPILPRATIRVNINDIEVQTLGPSTSSDISSDLHYLHFDAPPGTQLTTIADSDGPPCWSSPGRTILAEPTGWGVISDIDDTIKITGTLSPATVLKSTFLDAPTPVPGMPELYADLCNLLADPVFFYISASPYNLYPFLRTFRKEHFPDGTLILREASWQNLGGLISSLTLNVLDYKVDRIAKLHSWFPARQFVCVGDSTQKDPEAYAHMAKKYPGWIKFIAIRRVVGEDDISIAKSLKKNSAARFEVAFEGLDKQMWMVFDDAGELKKRLHALV